MGFEKHDAAIQALEQVHSVASPIVGEAHVERQACERVDVTTAQDDLRTAWDELARLQSALADERTWNHAIFESALDPIAILLDTGRIIAINNRGAQFFGYERQEFGLGLAVCRRLIEAQDGRMWAELREEGGTRFTFSLPVDCEEADLHEA